jgi:glucuronate isomerase
MSEPTNSVLAADRLFGPDSRQKDAAMVLYDLVRDLPIISPHGHVDPRLFSDPQASFGSPSDLLIIPDHYVFRMLYSQGVPLESLGVPAVDGSTVETDPRKIWQTFADHFYLFRATPSGLWLRQELFDVFGISETLNSRNAQVIYEQIAEQLTQAEFQPRALYERFNIEVLCTTDAAQDNLLHHQAIKQSGWGGRVLPTFRPDQVVNLQMANWRQGLEQLGRVCGTEIGSYRSLVRALEERRAYFRSLGATACDHASETAFTTSLSEPEAEAIFQRAIHGTVTAEDARQFTGHMLIEFARMSAEDGMVMQWHVGSLRNHNPVVFQRFGPDKGADIPLQSEYTRSAHPLLSAYGDDRRLRMVLFTLDESTYARELATLAGHYPALRLGPPWWFHDSVNGMERYFHQVIETAGLYNTAGFNDDTRAFLSIPARHDVWRRMSVNWVAGLLVRGIVTENDAAEMVADLAYRLAKQTYKLED